MVRKGEQAWFAPSDRSTRGGIVQRLRECRVDGLHQSRVLESMPVYSYICQANGRTLEVLHPMSGKVVNWGELCELAGIEPGDTPPDAPVEKLLFAPEISTPAGNSRLKDLGFTKLVRRDHGVYENVTARGSESRYMVAGDSSTVPDVSKTISD